LDPESPKAQQCIFISRLPLIQDLTTSFVGKGQTYNEKKAAEERMDEKSEA